MKNIIIVLVVILVVVGLIYNYYPEPKLPANANIDLLVVEKSKNQLLVL